MSIFRYLPWLLIVSCVAGVAQTAVMYAIARARGDRVGMLRSTVGIVLSVAACAFFLPTAIGVVCGVVPSVFSLMHPREGNPYVLASHAAYAAFWFSAAVWGFALGGADRLDARFRELGKDGALDKSAQDEGARGPAFPVMSTKLFMALTLGAGLVAELAFWFADLPPVP